MNTEFFQGFHFQPNSTADILDYAYGDGGGGIGLRTSDVDRARVKETGDDALGGMDMSGYFNRREYLYVQWRDKASGRIFEEKVDLLDKIPERPQNYSLYFEIWGKNLWVYFFPPKKFKYPYDPEEKATYLPGKKESNMFIEKPMYENDHDRQHIIFQTHNK